MKPTASDPPSVGVNILFSLKNKRINFSRNEIEKIINNPLCLAALVN
tara:strand:+ start:217 stop:357 length:141 start_codon:yes stop_codon:yes gene_type:complete